ncbi:MAG: hypothetical protein IKP50_00405 [Bacilli bacterium]|nr:hypothetical protein [Bacilli bacterium]
MKCGCENCKHCKVYKGDYWTPDDYDCTKADELTMSEEMFVRVWENCETWESGEEPLCEQWEEVTDEYWDKYAYEERYTE